MEPSRPRLRRAIKSVCTIILVFRALSATIVAPVMTAGDNGQKIHWSLTPLSKPLLEKSAIHPIDAFIRTKLAEENLHPSAPANQRALMRRLSYDLTGLPPTPENVEAFESDPDPNAYEAIVDRLLASPRYGEKWARHWLDVANYADTHGNDHDYERPNAWPYRDYVIRAFNHDKPYARFLKEQVAGDALYPEDPWSTVALGFIAAGPWDHTLMVTVRADTVDHRMAQNLDRDNMVSKVMGTFQGLTVHCARCHDHKFDPISQQEYYTLQAVFAGVDRAERPFDTDPEIHMERRRLINDQRALLKSDSTLHTRLDSPDVTRMVSRWEADRIERAAAWTPFEILHVVSTGGATLTRQTDGSWFASGVRPDQDAYLITARWRTGKMYAIKLEVLPDDRLPQGGPGRWDNGNFHLTQFRAFTSLSPSDRSATPMVFTRAIADYNEGPGISAAQSIDGKNETQWGVHPRYGEAHETVFEIKEPVTYPEETLFTISMENQGGAPGHGIGRFRLSASHDKKSIQILEPVSSKVADILRIPPDERSLTHRRTLALTFLQEINSKAIAALPPPRWVYAITDDFPADGPNFTPPKGPRPTHILTRGDLSKPGELVDPGSLSCVPGLSPELNIQNLEDESARRVALAHWLADRRNVLTWRSIVNRVWAWHFGQGICDTPNDLGGLGAQPSHPELLDWLAIWFRDEAQGSLKALHRFIVTSETWKQSTMTDHGVAVDPENRLLWRSHRQRLLGEEVRDSLLAMSGQLDLTEGGPPAVQFNARGDATFMSGGNPPFLDYTGFDPDAPAARRRAIYRFVFRTVPDPFMNALDCPDGDSPTPTRGASNTAQQALAMFNDTFAIRQCEHIAARLSTESNQADIRIESAFRLILLRQPTETELARFSSYAKQHGLANACQLLLNSNEFLYLD
jgi:hypothetical protein